MKKAAEKKNIVGLKELRNNIDVYISRIHNGESFTVVRRSSPVFKVSPVEADESESMWETIIDLTTIKKNGVSGKDVLKSLKRLNA